MKKIISMLLVLAMFAGCAYAAEAVRPSVTVADVVIPAGITAGETTLVIALNDVKIETQEQKVVEEIIVNIQEKTATEIMASKQRSYVTVSSIQASLEKALRELSFALCETLKIPQIEPVFAWDDSIIVDTLQEKNIFMQEISAGIRAPWEYRVAFLGETEEQAKKAISEIEQSSQPEMEYEDEDEFVEEKKSENNEEVEEEKEEETEREQDDN